MPEQQTPGVGAGLVGSEGMSDEEYLAVLSGKRDDQADCPRCDGVGQYLVSRDAHRSEGWVPCDCRNVARRTPSAEVSVLRARVAALESALSELLADTQHAEHDCGDEDCPVRRARAALGTEAGR